MSKLVNVLFALVLLLALVIVLSPEARQQAAEAVEDLEPTLRELDERVIVNVPSFDVSDQAEVVVPTPTPFRTPVVEDDVQIPVTGDEDSSDEPIIIVNWDALGDALRKFWERLRNVEINLNPDDNR